MLSQQVCRSGCSTIILNAESVEQYRQTRTTSGSAVVQQVTSQSVLPHFQEQLVGTCQHQYRQLQQLHRYEINNSSTTALAATTAVSVVAVSASACTSLQL
jgi:hypothetical protein